MNNSKINLYNVYYLKKKNCNQLLNMVIAVYMAGLLHC